METLMKTLTVKSAVALAGTLGFPSKMPGTSYGIPVEACNVGGKLGLVEGSTCYFCYAKKNNYAYPSVKISQARRLASLSNVGWSGAMVYMLRRAHGLDGHKVSKKIKRGGRFYHRWHDSGDLQGVWHLIKIIEVCNRTPEIKHWLPVRETGVLIKAQAMGIQLPANLTARVSAPMIDGPASDRFANTSTVHAFEPARGHSCPAPSQNDTCGKCRACWDSTIDNVSYHIH
jgi:hypothetical protein